ncbi:MAG: leishmanolysin-related zinc metalloendopeptidase [Gemmatimonadaceae bacterium]|nr:leishmanolysin-related zinc metalloendopeptidase [Gemmatimonadaceae bacterium]
MLLIRRLAAPALLSALVAVSACDESTDPSGTPASIRKVSGDSQVANIAVAIPRTPVVRVLDAGGGPVENARVTFTPADTASGTVVGGSVLTDAQGNASPTGWNLGRRVTAQRLVAKVAGVADSVVFRALTRAQGGLVLQPVSATAFTAPAFELVTPQPAVRLLDAFGNPVAGDSVTFVVDTVPFGRLNSSFIGAASTARVQTDSLGVATIPLRIGRRVGAHRVTAWFPNQNAAVSQVNLDGVATAGAAASLSLTPSACIGLPVNGAVSVGSLPVATVADAFGNPVRNATVNFSIVDDAGGVLTGATVTTDILGQARLGGWTTGPAAGRKSIRATVQNTTLQATATGNAGAGDFCIEVVYTVEPSATIKQAFERAADRWAQVIVGSLPPARLQITSSTTCVGATIAPGTYDIPNVRIYASIVPIDGVGRVLGSAGPCFYRGTTSGIVRPGELTIAGGMRFDSDDVNNLIANGTFESVILHEMGHVLGLGTFWNPMGFLTDPVPSPDCTNRATDTRYIGANARRELGAIGGVANSPVAVENTNGCGTANGHWLENSQGPGTPGSTASDRIAIGFNTELMTGFSEGGGVPMPLSRLTIGSLQDMGYTVNYAAADPYTMPLAIFLPSVQQQLSAGLKVRLIEEPVAPPRAAIRTLGTNIYRPALR